MALAKFAHINGQIKLQIWPRLLWLDLIWRLWIRDWICEMTQPRHTQATQTDNGKWYYTSDDHWPMDQEYWPGHCDCDQQWQFVGGHCTFVHMGTLVCNKHGHLVNIMGSSSVNKSTRWWSDDIWKFWYWNVTEF